MDDEAEDTRTRRDRVRALLADLTARGMRRRRGQSEAVLSDDLDRLVVALDHLSPACLDVLGEQILDMAGGARRDEWPSFVVMRGIGLGLQARPFEERRIVRSWLASVEGPLALARGELVPLYRFLRRHGRPPLAMDLRQISDSAAECVRRLQIIDERGTPRSDELDWLRAYRADESAALAILDLAKRGEAA